MKPEKLELITGFLKQIPVGFTGKVEINFFMGGITNVNKLESFKLGENKPKNGIKT
jgi:hypothetical protein